MKKPTFKSLKKKLDAVFSQWIRRKDATSEGLAVCVTCHRVDSWKALQCGHYEPRQHLATRWLEKNCHVQCYGCNCARKGNYTVYARFLIRKYGPSILDELAALSRQPVKFTAADLQEKLSHYQASLAALDLKRAA